MQTIHEVISGLDLGAPLVFENLAVFPLFKRGRGGLDYLVLDDALEDNTARVTEVSEGGSVPELLFENHGEAPVLLLDGEELVGAKQNRVLNLTILAPPNAAITIPVSCVEAGRWAWRSRKFHSASRAQYASLRSKKMAQVSSALAAEGVAFADQGAVWDDISVKMRRMNATSDSEAMSDIYEQYQDRLESYVGAFSVKEDQVGAVFAIDGQARGVEIFDKATTFERQFKKLLRSWGLDAIDSPMAGHPLVDVDEIEGLLDDVTRVESRSYEAVGLGDDVRLEGEDLDGGALVVSGEVVHLCVFRRVLDHPPR